ncbi:MAG: AhpC/TSA family protein [Verrucomicrobia bacterium]|nr:AhpC/TSA family protein [Leptolyngbya sp. ES-bin-22]
MKLTKASDLLWAHIKEQISPDFLALIDQSTEELMRSGIIARSLRVSNQAPNFTLSGARTAPVDLQALLSRGLVVLSFFQGNWCPFCRLELVEWQEALPAIRALGASFIAISPQAPIHARAVVQQHNLSYPVLSDRGNQVARQFGLVYRVPDYLHPVFEAMGHPLPHFNGDYSWELPLTGTFVIDRQGTILYAFVSEDFTKRAEPTDVIRVLQHLVVK